MKTVLILGANGRFGQAATQAFAQAGWRVLAQVRRAPVAPLPAGAVALTLPLPDTAALCARAGTVHAVVHAVLGVSLFMALSVGTLSVGALRRGGLPAWLAGLELLSALALAGLSLPVFGGPALVPVAAAVSLLSVWMMAAGVQMLRPMR